MAKFSLSKKQLFVGLSIVLVLAVALGAGVLVGLLQAPSDKQPAATQTKEKLPASITAVNALVGQGKPDEAQTMIDQSIQAPSTPASEKYMLYISKAGIANDKQDYQTALSALLEAEKIQETSDLAAKIGAAYAELGQKDKAVEYYKKAIRLNPQDNPMRERENEIFAEMIRNNGGQP